MNILVVGLGKLGLPLAVFLQSKGHDVWGYDVDAQRVSDLATGRIEHWEPGCDSNTVMNAVKLTKTLDLGVRETDMAFICAQTPIQASGNMELCFVVSAANELAYEANGKPYTIVMASTVMPGTCADIQTDMPENVRIVSMPVWIAMGSVLKDLENPPGLVLGCDCTRQIPSLILGWGCEHIQRVLDCWESSDHIGPALLSANQIHFTDTRTAEFIKLAHNAWCCIKMSWLGNIGDRATELGIDINALSAFMQRGGDRPGQFWKYGPPFGGPCFPRDLLFWLKAMGKGDPIGERADHVNWERSHALAHLFEEYSNVCIVGEGYKKGVPVEEASVSGDIAALLRHTGKTVTYWPDEEGATVFLRMHDDDTTAFPMPGDGRPIINAWRQQ